MRKLCLLLALFAVGSATADTLLLEGIAANAMSASERPQRGMSKANVETRFGMPTARISAVGTPPISRWEYPAFVVYFEYDHVVHAAVRR
jgi:hypothetical protein